MNGGGSPLAGLAGTPPTSVADARSWGEKRAARTDLYTDLAEVLGPDRAEILMAQLPRFDPADVATKTDLAELRAATKSDVADLAAATKSDFAELRGELRDGLAAVNQRLDRLFLTLLVGMFGMVAALISLVFTVA